ncbi:MAG: aldo/keto reductase [Deltaproteobacteria bacterium]|nr:aldo/keto reductase [Deltaproteobacteria bacterium]
MSGKGFEWFRRFGKTGLTTSCLAIGGGAGISSADVLYAFDQGIRTFFFSSDLHHFAYAAMAPALRQLCGRGSSHRDEVTLINVTYIRHPRKLLGVLYDIWGELQLETVDVLMWGWMDIGDEASLTSLLRGRSTVVGPESNATQFISASFGPGERLKQGGAIRNLGASFHDIPLARFFCHEPELDVAMVRLNVAHRRATTMLFPDLPPAPERPGIMTFKTMASGLGELWVKPPGWSLDWQPTPADLYRFPLSHPEVDVVLTGPRNRAEIDQSIAAAQKGPLSEEEFALFVAWGDAHRKHLGPRAPATAGP